MGGISDSLTIHLYFVCSKCVIESSTNNPYAKIMVCSYESHEVADRFCSSGNLINGGTQSSDSLLENVSENPACTVDDDNKGILYLWNRNIVILNPHDSLIPYDLINTKLHCVIFQEVIEQR